MGGFEYGQLMRVRLPAFAGKPVLEYWRQVF
jgi:hypothetical protein